MDKRDSELDRLLRAAAPGADLPKDESPFGFDTRVVATWRSQRTPAGAKFAEVTRIFRRVAMGAMLVAVSASAAAVWQFQENDELNQPTANAYAIADTAIEAGAWQ